MTLSDEIVYCPECGWNLSTFGYTIGNNGPIEKLYCSFCGWIDEPLSQGKRIDWIVSI